LVKNNQGKCQHHLFVFIPFGFKSPLILELVIIMSDNTISHIIPTSYSYWCSHLNLMTHITKSYNHFLYIVDLDTKGYTVSRLCTRPRFPKTQTRYTWGSTLSYFRSLFNDHTRPNIFISLLLKINHKGLIIKHSERIIHFFKELFRTFPILFYKSNCLFLICQVFFKTFFYFFCESFKLTFFVLQTYDICFILSSSL
jgi:hypothetical protein